jgi:AraC-like DNA-binding protein
MPKRKPSEAESAVSGVSLASFPADIVAQIQRRIPAPGVATSAIPYLSFLRFNQPTRLSHGVLQPSICLVVQGRKRILVGRNAVEYGSADYVAASMSMLVAGQVLEASATNPYLGIKLDLDPREIAAVVLETKISVSSKTARGPAAFVARADQALCDAISRLVKLLDHPRDIPFLAPVIKQEILYRLLTAGDTWPVWQRDSGNRDSLAVGRAISWLRSNLSSPLRVEALAMEARLGVTNFHRKFKAVTTLAPLQFQKRLRLLESRRLLLTGTVDAATAAFLVGYESPSQFSREYRRLFGSPPREDIAQLRQDRLVELRQD